MDGAKPSCATRMYVALFRFFAGYDDGKGRHPCYKCRNGFVHNEFEVNAGNLYRLQHDVLHNKVDAILWDIVKEQKVIH